MFTITPRSAVRVAPGQTLSAETRKRLSRRSGRVVELTARVLPLFGTFERGTGTAGAVSCKEVPPDVASHANATWVHLATFGTWRGHPAGEFSFDADTFGEIVRNFEATKTPVPFKYEHPLKDMGQPVPSAGKVYDLKVTDSGLWAFTKFTDRAAEHIRAEEYSYCSVVVIFDSEDRVTADEIGAELLEVGLTDNPFIDGQEPIRLDAQQEAA